LSQQVPQNGWQYDLMLEQRIAGLMGHCQAKEVLTIKVRLLTAKHQYFHFFGLILRLFVQIVFLLFDKFQNEQNKIKTI